MNLLLILAWFAAGFIFANGIRCLHIIRSSSKLQRKAGKKPVSNISSLKAGYKKSLPYLPVYYLAVWLTCSTFLFLEYTSGDIHIIALQVGVLWWLLTLLLEIMVWVLVRHPLQLTWKEMYVYSQPWISLSYYAVLVSPMILSFIMK